MASPSLPVLLIVDDDDDIRFALRLLFEEEGFAVEEAENGQVALSLLGAGLRPQAIILDLMMPVMNGWAFREQQQSAPALRDIPVVIFTAAEPAGASAAAAGDAAVLRKPVEPTRLIEAVRAAAGMP